MQKSYSPSQGNSLAAQLSETLTNKKIKVMPFLMQVLSLIKMNGNGDVRDTQDIHPPE